MRRRSAPGKGIKDNGILVGGNFQDALDEPHRLGRVERRLAAEYRHQLLLRLVRMPHVLVFPEIGWRCAADIGNIGLFSNAALALVHEIILWPRAFLQNLLRHLPRCGRDALPRVRRVFGRAGARPSRQHDRLDTLTHIIHTHAADLRTLLVVANVAQLIRTPAIHQRQHCRLVIRPTSTGRRIYQCACNWILNCINHSLMRCRARGTSIGTFPRLNVIVGVLVFLIHLRRARQLVGLPAGQFGVGEDMLDFADDSL